MNVTRWVAAGAVVLGMAAGSARGTDWYVATGGSDGAAGTSWATAKATIQAAGDVSVDGDVVWVTKGV